MIYLLKKEDLEKIRWQNGTFETMNQDDNYVYFDEVEENEWWWLSNENELTLQEIANATDWEEIKLNQEEIEDIKKIGRIII